MPQYILVPTKNTAPNTVAHSNMALYYWHTQDDMYRLTHGKVRVIISA